MKTSPNESAGARPTVGVVGTGNMGAALVRGWLRAEEDGCSEGPGRLLVWDKIEAASRRLLVDGYVGLASSLPELAAETDVILVVVKPKDAAEVLTTLAGILRPDQAVVSSMSGLALERIRGLLGPGPALFRIMPNLGVELGAGAIAFAAEPDMPADRGGGDEGASWTIGHGRGGVRGTVRCGHGCGGLRSGLPGLGRGESGRRRGGGRYEQGGGPRGHEKERA